MPDPAPSTPDREIVTERLIHAPREMVFAAWTDPEQVARWWGPDGFRNTIHEMDVRPGGVWRFVMHGPDGTDYQSELVFIEIVKPELIVYDKGRPFGAVTGPTARKHGWDGLNEAYAAKLGVPKMAFPFEPEKQAGGQ